MAIRPALAHAEDPGLAAGEAVHAISRLLGIAAGTRDPAVVRERLVEEARRLLDVPRSVLIEVAEAEARAAVVAVSPAGPAPGESIGLDELPEFTELLEARLPALPLTGETAARLDRALGGRGEDGALLLPMRARETVPHVLALVGGRAGELPFEELEVACAFATAAAASLAQTHLAARHADQLARQAALARAAKTLNESLEPGRVLVRICEEAARILGGDNAAVYAGGAREGLRVEAAYGLPADVLGTRLQPGEGLAGKAVERDEPLLTNDYQAMPHRADAPWFANVRSCLSVPLHWDGELRGALSVGYDRSELVTRDHLALLEAFGELAAAAFRNASAHAGLEVAARTDALTGCLNHAALQDALRRELERCRRTGQPVSFALMDLDEFKDVNEEHGHLAGDEVLRRVGRALRQVVRAYDVAARYGGDEFAVVAFEAVEADAAEVAARAVEAVRGAVADLDYLNGAGGATAGVAQWDGREEPARLIERADRALLYGKQRHGRGAVISASEVPEGFRPTARRQDAVSEPR